MTFMFSVDCDATHLFNGLSFQKKGCEQAGNQHFSNTNINYTNIIISYQHGYIHTKKQITQMMNWGLTWNYFDYWQLLTNFTIQPLNSFTFTHPWFPRPPFRATAVSDLTLRLLAAKKKNFMCRASISPHSTLISTRFEHLSLITLLLNQMTN